MTLVLPMADAQARIRELSSYFDWAARSEERAELSAVAAEDAQVALAVSVTDKIVKTRGDHKCNRCQRLIPSGSRVYSVSVQRGSGRGGCWWTCEECRPTGEEKKMPKSKTNSRAPRTVRCACGALVEIPSQAVRDKDGVTRSAHGNRWGRPPVTLSENERARVLRLHEQGWTLEEIAKTGVIGVAGGKRVRLGAKRLWILMRG